MQEAIICLKFYLRLFEAVLFAFREADLFLGAALLFGADRFAADLLLGADLFLTALVDRFAIAQLLYLLVFLL